MSRLNEYTFIITDLLTGDVIDVVEMSSFYWDEIYNNPGAGLGTARYDLATTTQENFSDWTRGFWVVKGGDIKWGGIIGKVQRRGSTRVISVPVVGFWEYLRNRLLRSDLGMTYGTIKRTSDIEWRNIEHFHIVKDLIDHSKQFPDGDIGQNVIWDELSGQQATKIHRTFSRKWIGSVIDELAARITGFDFYQVYSWDGNKPKVDFKLTYPKHEVVLDDLLLFQPERVGTKTITLIRALELDGASGGYASTTGEAAITSDLQVTAYIEADDYTPSTTQTLKSKWTETGDQRSWRFQILSDGKLRLEWSTDGTATGIVTEDSGSPTSFVDGTEGFVRVTLDVNDGAGNYQVDFEESSDGVNWSNLKGPRTFGDTFGDEF